MPASTQPKGQVASEVVAVAVEKPVSSTNCFILAVDEEAAANKSKSCLIFKITWASVGRTGRVQDI